MDLLTTYSMTENEINKTIFPIMFLKLIEQVLVKIKKSKGAFRRLKLIFIIDLSLKAVGIFPVGFK